MDEVMLHPNLNTHPVALISLLPLNVSAGMFIHTVGVLSALPSVRCWTQ